jgi:chitodextrinase
MNIHTRRAGLSLGISGMLILLQATLVLAQVTPTVDTTDTAPSSDTTTTADTSMTEPTADTAGPEFLSVTAMSAEPTTLVAAWTTDELAYGWIEYGLTNAYGSKTEKTMIASMEQAQTITGLNPSTTYHYRIAAVDEAGNISYTADRTAITASEPEPTDNQPPEITDNKISNVTTSGATFTITTDEAALVELEYGTTESYGLIKTSGEEFATNHTITLTGLSADTTYYYYVRAQDVAGNQSESFTNEFATLPEQQPAPTEPLAIIDPLVSDIQARSVTISWQTNRAADGAVHYGVGNTNASATSAAGVTAHEITLTGLSPETNYSYRVTSKTTDGQTAAVEDLEFTTLADPEPAALEIHVSEITTSIDTHSAVISWKTSPATTGRVEYGTTAAHGLTTEATASGTTHTRTLANLTPNTTYHFQIVASDTAGNRTVTEDYVFKTSAAATPTAPAVSEPEDPATETDLLSAQEIAVEKTVVDTVVIPTPAELIPPPAPTNRGVGPPATPLKPLALIHAEALDGQALFIVDRPATHNDARIRIVRNAHFAPKGPRNGTIVYQGPLTSFTDTKLVNGHTYHYAIYAVDSFRGFSAPILIQITPKSGKTQSSLRATPTIPHKAPHYVFTKDLRLTSAGREVAHLQNMLAKNPALYPEGLVTGYFGPLTRQAVIRFQKRHQIAPAAGYFGPLTRARVVKVTTGK